MKRVNTAPAAISLSIGMLLYLLFGSWSDSPEVIGAKRRAATGETKSQNQWSLSARAQLSCPLAEIHHPGGTRPPRLCQGEI